MLPDEVRNKAGTKEFIKLVCNLDFYFLFIFYLFIYYYYYLIQLKLILIMQYFQHTIVIDSCKWLIFSIFGIFTSILMCFHGEPVNQLLSYVFYPNKIKLSIYLSTCVYTRLPELDKLLKSQGQLFEKQVDLLTGLVPYFVQNRLNTQTRQHFAQIVQLRTGIKLIF